MKTVLTKYSSDRTAHSSPICRSENEKSILSIILTKPSAFDTPYSGQKKGIVYQSKSGY